MSILGGYTEDKKGAPMTSLAKIRKERGLTQRQLATMAGLSIGVIARIEQGPLIVTHIRSRSRITKALNVQVDDVDEFGPDVANDIPTVIYALASSDDNRLRYVGQTVRIPDVRLAEHCVGCHKTNGKSHLHNWLRGILDRDELPIITVLEIVPYKDALDRERWWIRHLADLGEDLLNTSDFQPSRNYEERHAVFVQRREARIQEIQQIREERANTPKSPARKRIPDVSPEEIREFRDRHGLTQTQLSALLGYNNSSISVWESGKRNPPPGLRVLLLDVEGRIGQAE